MILLSYCFYIKSYLHRLIIVITYLVIIINCLIDDNNDNNLTNQCSSKPIYDVVMKEPLDLSWIEYYHEIITYSNDITNTNTSISYTTINNTTTSSNYKLDMIRSNGSKISYYKMMEYKRNISMYYDDTHIKVYSLKQPLPHSKLIFK